MCYHTFIYFHSFALSLHWKFIVGTLWLIAVLLYYSQPPVYYINMQSHPRKILNEDFVDW